MKVGLSWLIGGFCFVHLVAGSASATNSTNRTVVFLNDQFNIKTFIQTYITNSNIGWKNYFDISSPTSGFDPGSSRGSSGKSLNLTQQLHNLNALVFTGKNTQEFYDLKSSVAVEWVEAEFFHPLPFSVQRNVQKSLQRKMALNKRLQINNSSKIIIHSDEIAEEAVPAVDPLLKNSMTRPWGIKAVKSPEAWALGYQGQGVKVLVLDTGIDKDHPVLKNQFRLGKNFLGKDQQVDNMDDQPEVPHPEEAFRQMDRLPYEYFDNVGHGTHVAGTILAEAQEAGFAGVAPKAELYVGKVCDLQGCSNVGEILGLDWGIENKIRVVNLSLGGRNGSRGERMAMQKAERMGLVIVAASGNDGSARVDFPGAYGNSISVGAVDSTLNKAKFSQWGNELDVMAPGVGVLSSVPVGSAKVSKVFVNENSDPQSASIEISSKAFYDSPLVENDLNLELVDFGVGFLSTQDLQGKVALIDRGSITFELMVRNAVRLGAKAALIVNNEPGLFEGSIDPNDKSMKLSPIPVFMIEKESGEKFRQSLGQGSKVQIQMKTLAADYDVYDGTSMATPHAAGVVALMLSAKPELTPPQVRHLLNQSCEEIPGEPPFRVGHGLIQADKALGKTLEIR